MAELTYESAFPGRFIKAALLDGKSPTLTISKAYLEVLEGEKGKENKLIVGFEGKTMEFVMNKTNAFCLREMFGSKVAGWVGKRIVLSPSRCAFGPKQVDCLRVTGSPDIAADIEVSARIGRKNFKAIMKATKGALAPKPADVSEQIAAADDRMRELVGASDVEPDYPGDSYEGPRDYGFGGEQ